MSITADDLRARFFSDGVERFETSMLVPAADRLDLYGENIRARAYIVQDPSEGEQMLRPDFTVSLVEACPPDDEACVRHTYAGKVFRRPVEASPLGQEYTQLGFEVFGGADPLAAEIEVVSRILAAVDSAVGARGLCLVTGDVALLASAVETLRTSPERKAALRHHIWRPQRFRVLLDHYAGRAPLPSVSDEALRADPQDAGPVIGLRDPAEVSARLETLRADRAEPPVPREQVEMIDAILALDLGVTEAAPALEALANRSPETQAAVDRVSARLSALAEQCGAVGADLRFRGDFGLTSLEYYDGFVFGLSNPDAPRFPPLALGGRYDALTRALRKDAGFPAVGGVIRPDLLRRVAATGWEV